MMCWIFWTSFGMAGGPSAIYVVTYDRLENRLESALQDEPAYRKPARAEGAQASIELLERIGVDFHLKEVRGALEDILRLGAANIPDPWLSDQECWKKDSLRVRDP